MDDLISRQEAIEAIEAVFPVDPMKSVHTQGIALGAALAKTYIEQLPSAQPEQAIKDCRNCKYGRYNDYHETMFCYNSDDCTNWNLWEPAELPSAQPEPRWIPCSERLPEEYGNYLITTYDGNVDIGTIDPNGKSVWSACDADGFYWMRNVIAWMPLPEPYRERREE